MSPPGLLGPETLLLQGLQHRAHLISLQLDHTVFPATTTADRPLELFEQGLGSVITQFKARDLGDGLSLLACPGALHPHPLLCQRRLGPFWCRPAQGCWITAELAPAPLAHAVWLA